VFKDIPDIEDGTAYHSVKQDISVILAPKAAFSSAQKIRLRICSIHSLTGNQFNRSMPD